MLETMKKDELIDYNDTETIPSRHEVRRGGRKSLYMAAVIAAGGGFVIGFDTGAISGIMVLDPFVERFLNTDSTYREGLLVAMMLLTATIASLSSGYLCDRLGRKHTILLGTTVFAIGALLETISVNFSMLMAGRLFVGFGEGFLTNSIPLYHTEIAPPDVRGRLICFFSATLSVGTIVGFFVNVGTSYLTTDWSWRAPFLIQLIACLCLYGAAFLPYTPRWLINQGRKDEALAVLAQLHESTIDDPEVRNEFDYVCEELETERSFGNRTFIECFRGTNLKRTLWAFFTADGCACTGIYSINFYLPQIIQQTGVGNNSLSIATSGSSNILVLIVTLLTILFIDKLGRRPVFMSGAFITGLSMFIVGAVFQTCYVLDDEGNVGLANDHARGAVIAFIFVFQAAYAYSWGPVAYVYPAEISNTRMRAKTLALAYGFNWVVGIFMTFVMPIFMEKTIYGPYYLFGSCCALLFIGSMYLPETKGKTLEEIDRLFNPIEL